MTGQHLLLLIALTSAMSAVTSWRRKVVSWTLVNGAFLVATALGYWFAPERAGLWLIGPYLLLVVVPIVALVWFHRMLAARRYGVAHWLARIAFVLHPAPGHRNLVRLNRVFRLAASGEVDAAAELLRATGHEQNMKLEMLRLHNQ